MHFSPVSRKTASRATIAVLVTGGMVALGPSSATARWQVHNGSEVTEIVAPPGGTEAQTCADRVRGRSGWHTGVIVPDDPASYTPAPATGAYDPVTYDVWKAPPGFSEGSFRDDDAGGVEFLDSNGDPVPAVFVTQFTTPPRGAVSPEPLNPSDVSTEPGDTNLYLFSRTAFSAALPNSVDEGELLGLKPAGDGSTFINLTAIDCGAVHISFVRYNPPGPDTGNNAHLNKEIVVVTNPTAQARSLTGWTLRDSENNVYRFPTTRLLPGDLVTVHRGKGTKGPGQRYWGRESYVWDNTGERAVLRNRAGTRVDACKWGNGAGATTC